MSTHIVDMVLANRMRFTQSLCWLLWMCPSWSQFSTLGPLRRPLLCYYTFMAVSHFRWDCFQASLLNMRCYFCAFKYIYSKSCIYHRSHVIKPKSLLQCVQFLTNWLLIERLKTKLSSGFKLFTTWREITSLSLTLSAWHVLLCFKLHGNASTLMFLVLKH